MLRLAFAIFGQRVHAMDELMFSRSTNQGGFSVKTGIPRPVPDTFISTCTASPYHPACTIQATLAAPEATGISYQFFFAITMDQPRIALPHISLMYVQLVLSPFPIPEPPLG